jgi:hypothetical protein
VTYYRLASPTQTPAVARQQHETGEIWGSQARGGDKPKVKAYVGELPSGRIGVEFTTDTAPDLGCPPGQALWTGPRDGVEVGDNYAKIRVVVTKNMQN